MQLLKLQMKGITSFSEQTTIDFQSILKSKEIFAITGPTGSGKSTILTALFLALYGKTPKNLQRQEVISLEKTEGEVELDFKYKNNIYKAIWSAKTHGKDGPLKNPKYEKKFYCNDQPSDKTPEEVIQLTSDQFAKTIVINQGQFADFISSAFSERRKILEKIYQVEEISLIGSANRKLIKEIENEIIILEGKIESGLIFDPKSFEQIKKRHHEKEKQKKDLDKVNIAFELYDKKLKEIDQLFKLKSKDKEDLEKIQEKLIKAREKYQKDQSLRQKKKDELNKHKNLIIQTTPFIEQLTEQIQQKQTQQTFLEQTKNNIDESLKKKSQIEALLKKEQTQIEQKEKSLEQLKTTIKKNLKNCLKPVQVEELDKNHIIYSKVIPSIDEELSSAKSIYQHIKNEKNNVLEIKKEISEIEKEAKQQKQRLEDDKIKLYQFLSNENKDRIDKDKEFTDIFETLKKQLSDSKQRTEKTQEALNNILEHQSEYKSKQKYLEREVEELQLSTNEKESKIKNSEAQINKLLKKLKDLENSFQEEQNSFYIQNIKNELKDLDQCPICDQKVDNDKVKHLNHEHFEEKLNQKKKKIEKLNTQKKQIEQDLQEKQSFFFYLKKSKKEKESLLKSKQKEIIQIKDKYNKKLNEELDQEKASELKISEHPLTEIDFSYFNKQTQERMQRLDEKEKKVSQILIQNEHINEGLYKLREQYSSKKSTLKKKEQFLSDSSQKIEDSIDTIVEQLGINQKGTSEQKQDIYKQFEQEWRNIKDLHEQALELSQKVQSSKNIIKKDKQLLFETTHKYEQEKQKEKELQAQIKNNIVKMQEQLESLKQSKHKGIEELPSDSTQLTIQQIKSLKSHLDSHKNDLERQEEVSNKEFRETERTYDNTENQKREKELNIKNIDHQLISTIHGLKNMISQDQTLTNLPEQNQILSDSKDRLTNIQRGLSKIHQATEAELLVEEKLQFLTHFYHDQFLLFFDQIQQKSQDLKNSIIELITQIKTQEEKIQKQKTIKQQLKTLQQKLKRKKNLQETLGQDDFTRFAMSFIEDQLLEWTNFELKNLCEGRYQLTTLTRNKKTGPEFFVKDHWKGSTLRHINTLSGGETFLVSLAMALGLAELTKGQTEMETLIIDEGFGTLDSQAVEDALEILNSIALRGKQIGVISHVKEMTDRIPINIQLIKAEDGHSKIEVLY